MTDTIGSRESATSIRDPSRRLIRPHEIIKAHALEFAQLFFSEAENVGENLVWNPVQEQSCITIVDKYVFNLEQVQSRPAIVGNRGPQSWAKSSGFRQFQGENMRTGERTYTDLVRGSITLSCFSREGIEAEEIAGILFEAVQTFRDVLRKMHQRGRLMPQHLGFFRVESAQMGEEALVKSDSRPDLSVVPIAIAASVQRRWALRPNARKLQGINTSVNVPGVTPGAE